MAELRASISIEELEEWEYYFALTPDGDEKVVHHVAQLTNIVAQVNGNKTKTSDFIINYEPDKVSKKKKLTKSEIRKKWGL